MIPTRGLRHVHINVRDIKRSIAFYQQVFGMVEMFWEGDAMVFLTTPGGDDLITLHQVDVSRPVGNGGVAHIGWELVDEADLDDAVAEIVRAGGKVLERGEHTPGEPYLYFSDPDGYVIEL